MSDMLDIALKYVRGLASVEAYWEDRRKDFTFETACRGCEQWAEKLRSEVDKGFWRLHALDRSDAFWAHSNRLATVGKLLEFADAELAMSPEDVNAAWLSLAMRLQYGLDHLDQAVWHALKLAGQFDVDFFVKVALNALDYRSHSDLDRLLEIAVAIGVEGEVAAALTRLQVQ